MKNLPKTSVEKSWFMLQLFPIIELENHYFYNLYLHEFLPDLLC
jgi:hypothetical protein